MRLALDELACALVIGGATDRGRIAALVGAVMEALPPDAPAPLSTALDELVDQASKHARDPGQARFGQAIAVAQSKLAAAAESARPTGARARADALGLPEWVDDSLLAEYLSGTRGALEQLQELLIASEGGAPEPLRQLKALLHGMKGEAGTVGVEEVGAVCHAMEDVIAQGTPTGDVLEQLLAARDWIAEGVDRILGGGPRWRGPAALIAAIHDARLAPVRPAQPDEETLALFGEFHDESMETLSQADGLLVQLEQGTATPDAIHALFRIFHSIKGVASFVDQAAVGKLAHATEDLLGQIRDGLAPWDPPRSDAVFEATAMLRRLIGDAKSAITSGNPAVEPSGYDPLLNRLQGLLHGEIIAVPKAAPERRAAKVDGPAAPTEAGPRSLIKETVKCDLERVDALVELIGELAIIEAMVVHDPEIAALTSQRVRQRLNQLSKVSRDLQRTGLGLRMVPIHSVFQKMARLVRDVGRKAGKQVRLVVAGETTEMDRSLVEQINDPLVHLVRNAIDHGLETPDQRRAAGKDPNGTIELRAGQEGGNIVVTVKDDGRGLNRDRILKSAIGKGLLSAAAGAMLNDRDVWELLFAPGFSTAERVTEISGRGVGLDVVRRNIEGMRGRIGIDTVERGGTSFHLVLPLTLAIIDGMLIRCGTERFVVPTHAIIESLKPEPGSIRRFADQNPVLFLRGSLIPVVHLGALLGVSGMPLHGEMESANAEEGLAVIIETGNNRLAMIVDEVLGQQQVVVKTLAGLAEQAGRFNGAAILSDGGVGLILDPGAFGQGRSAMSFSSTPELAA